MALAIDSQMASNVGASVSSNATLTFSFTNTAGTYIVVTVSFGSGAAFSINTVTYNGVAVSAILTPLSYDTGKAGVGLFGLLLPATGANNVVVSMTGAAGGASAIEAGAISFTGNHATVPIAQSFAGSSSTGTTPSLSATSTTAGNYVLDVCANGSAINTSGNTFTWSKNLNTLSAGGNGASSYVTAGGTKTMSYSVTSDTWGIQAVEIAAAGGGASVTYPELERNSPRAVARGVAGGVARSFVRRDRIFVPAYAVLGDLGMAA